MKTGILYFTTCFHGFGILRHVDPFVRMLHIYLIQHSRHNNYNDYFMRINHQMNMKVFSNILSNMSKSLFVYIVGCGVCAQLLRCDKKRN